MTASVVTFYAPQQPFYEFSNFYKGRRRILIDDAAWPTVEHYFQAQKFYVPDSPRHMEYYRIMAMCDSPMKLFMMGTQKRKGGYAAKWVVNTKLDSRTVNDVIDLYKDLAIRPDWDAAKEDVMRKALAAKFAGDPALRGLLLGTGTARIVEDSPRDSYWGAGKDGRGLNRLGVLLMEIRSAL